MGVWGRGAEEGNHRSITSEGLCVSVKLCSLSLSLSVGNRYIDPLWPLLPQSELPASVCHAEHPPPTHTHTPASSQITLLSQTVAVHELLHREVFLPRLTPLLPTYRWGPRFSIFSIVSFKLAPSRLAVTKSLSRHTWGLPVWRAGT